MTTLTTSLKGISPFHLLPDSVLTELASVVVHRQYEKEQHVYQQDKTPLDGVDIIIAGQYRAYFYDSNGVVRLQENYGTGDIYGGSSVLLNKKHSIRTVVADAGTQVLALDKVEFQAICRSYNNFFEHFTTQFGHKMLNAEYAHFVNRHNTVEENFMDADIIFTRKVSSITPRLLVECSPSTPIHEVARLMRDKTVNCVYITDGSEPLGFVSKESLIKSALAEAKDVNSPVIEVVEQDIISIDQTALVFEALLALFPTKQEYVLVKDGEKRLGYLSRYRLLTEHAQSPLVFIQSVKLSNTTFDLKEKWHKVPEMISQMIGRGVHAEIVNRIVTTIADEILFRIIEGVHDEMGPAPAKYCFMVIGSEGRQEQTLATDQDNAIIYEDKANEQRELVRAYFLEFAKKISTRLDEVGFKFCSGGFMAMNPEWCHSLSHWKRKYNSWINQAAPETVIKFSTFFDCRHAYGDKSLFDELSAHMLECVDRSSAMFLMNLVTNALQYEPPLTMFNSIRTFTKNERKVFDIKKAMTPIVDLARMYSLKHKVIANNTGHRLKLLLEQGHMNEKRYKELMHAYYYLMGVRLKNQANQILIDFKEPSNLLEPERLTKVEQATLKQIFKFIKDVQYLIRMNFGKTS